MGKTGVWGSPWMTELRNFPGVEEEG